MKNTVVIIVALLVVGLVTGCSQVNTEYIDLDSFTERYRDIDIEKIKDEETLNFYSEMQTKLLIDEETQELVNIQTFYENSPVKKVWIHNAINNKLDVFVLGNYICESNEVKEDNTYEYDVLFFNIDDGKVLKNLYITATLLDDQGNEVGKVIKYVRDKYQIGIGTDCSVRGHFNIKVEKNSIPTKLVVDIIKRENV